MMYYFIYSLLLVCSVQANEETKLLLPNTSDTETSKFNSITECIITISNMVLYFRPTVAILKQNTQSTEENEFINELIDKLVEHNIPQVIVEDINYEGIQHLLSSSLTIAFFDKCDDVTKFSYKHDLVKFKFLFIISSPSSDDCGKEFQDIGNYLRKFDITIMTQDVDTKKNKMFTILPKIDENTCQETVDHATHINTCFNGTIQNNNIFPIKNPANLNKCPLKVGMATLYPFSKIKNFKSLKLFDHIEEIEGSDFEILKIISDYFNATLDLYYIFRKEENPHGDTSFIIYLVNGSWDACAGGLYRIYGDSVEYSGIYVSQGVFWMYFAERADRSWEILIQKLDGMYIFIIFYLTYSMVWYLISLFDGGTVSLMTTLLYSWGAFVGASSLQKARSLKQKILNLMYLLMGVYFSAYIGMHFYAFFTIRAPPRLLQTNHDIMESRKTPYLIRTAKYFVEDEKYVKFANSSRDCYSFLDCCEKSLIYNGLTVILQAIFYDFQARTAVNDEARVLRASENVLTVYNEMLLWKNFSLVTRFQQVTQRLFEAGITRKLITEAVGLSVVAKAESANSNMMSNSYSCEAGCSITLQQFAGVFYVWIFGCGLSCVVFVIEIISKREENQASRGTPNVVT